MNKEEKKRFWQTEVNAQTRQYIYLGGGAACVTGAMTVIFALLLNPFMWLDAILTIGLAVGILVGKSRACAVVMLVYFIVSKLMQLGAMTAGSLLVAVCFFVLYVFGTIGTFRYHEQLVAYENEQAATASSAAEKMNGQDEETVDFDEEADEKFGDAAFYDEEDIYYDEKE